MRGCTSTRAPGDHQRYFIPNCTCLDVVTVDVMRPQVGATSPAALVNATRPGGTAQVARLNMLKASSRSCTDCRARAANDFTSDTSAFTSPGPTAGLLP